MSFELKYAIFIKLLLDFILSQVQVSAQIGLSGVWGSRRFADPTLVYLFII